MASMDRLSIDLLHIILSFLNTPHEPPQIDFASRRFPDPKPNGVWSRRYIDNKEAARTMILSKTFQQAWSSLPDLSFTDILFTKLLGFVPSNLDEIQHVSNAKQRFANFVYDTLTRYQQHNILPLTLRLTARVDDDNAANILEKSLRKAVEVGVNEVFLHLARITSPILIQTIFALKQLVALNLFVCDLVRNGVDNELLINCSFLRTLELEYVTIDEGLIRKLIHSCPLIEELQFLCCDGPQTIQVANLPNLKRLHVFTVNNQKVDVNAPSLELMIYGQKDAGAPYLLDINSTHNLKSLTLQCPNIYDHEFHSLIANCPVIEELKLEGCYELEHVKVSSNSLSFLSIMYGGALAEVIIDTPMLNLFEFHGERVKLCFASGSPEKTKSRVTYLVEYLDEEASFLELSKCLMTYKHSDSISLDIWLSNDIIFDKNVVHGLRDDKNIPEFDQVNIQVCPSSSSPLSTYSALMEGLMWSFSPKVLSVKCEAERKTFMKYLCKELLLIEYEDRRDMDPKCWMNYFKRAKFEGRDNEWQPLHSWRSMEDVLENLGDECVLKLSHV